MFKLLSHYQCKQTEIGAFILSIILKSTKRFLQYWHSVLRPQAVIGQTSPNACGVNSSVSAISALCTAVIMTLLCIIRISGLQGFLRDVSFVGSIGK